MTIAEAVEIALMDSRATERMVSRAPQLRVIARTERRRSWSMDQKREIVAESLSGGVSVSAVARKHDISPGQLFTWRRQLLAGNLDVVAQTTPIFAGVDVVGPSCANWSDQIDGESGRSDGSAPTGGVEGGRPGVMDIVIDGVTVRVDASVDEAALQRVLAALRRR